MRTEDLLLKKIELEKENKILKDQIIDYIDTIRIKNNIIEKLTFDLNS